MRKSRKSTVTSFVKHKTCLADDAIDRRVRRDIREAGGQRQMR